MKKNSFIDFIIKNRYIILFVSIVLVISWLGIIRALLEIAVTLFLILLAIYIGKRVQEDDDYINRMFRDKEDVVYKVKEEDEE